MSATPPVRYGAWITLNSTVLTEQVARLGFDFVVVDGQHGLLGYAEIRDSLIALTAGGCQLPIARVSSHDPGEVGRMLDSGAKGIIVPMVNTAEDARRIAQAARYPTSGGQRSYSPVRSGDHFGTTPGNTDRGVMILAMIETRTALEEVSGILDTPGIDGVFVGPYDLSLALGATIPFEESVLPELETALATVAAETLSRGKIAGIYAGSGEDAALRASQGYTLVNTTHDLDILLTGMAGELAAARASTPSPEASHSAESSTR
ncbi:HpcH/HpaI aldolase/citrate lyase family protein [Pseudoclavibacter sp. RFBA6]|uniref:HpcH/HpaI aldolase family protein n=1 Tax=Pseudoclavibacter sp. RFBA6 TaxID=2080573 RepID=UPI0015E21A28|nr:aldolase/citrate lyase family protein [Pseudoclavibacter sp. RFBA6]